MGIRNGIRSKDLVIHKASNNYFQLSNLFPVEFNSISGMMFTSYILRNMSRRGNKLQFLCMGEQLNCLAGDVHLLQT